MLPHHRAVRAGGFALLLCGCARGDELKITSWELTSSGGAGPVRVELPAHLPESALARERELVLRARVFLPTELRDRDLLLRAPTWQAPVTLVVNGRSTDALGQMETPPYRTPGAHTFRVPRAFTERGELDLELHARHTWSQSAWIDAAPRLLTAGGEAAHAARERDRANDMVAWCALAAGVLSAFSYALVILFDRRRASHGWFAVEAFFGAFYAAFVLGLTQELFGPYEAVVLLVAVSCSAVAGVHFTHAYFQRPRPHWGWLAAALVVAITALALRDPFVGPRVVPWLAVPLIVANIVHQTRVLRAAARHPPQRPTAIALVLAWVAVGVFGASDMALWLGLGDLTSGLRLGSLGIGAITLAHFVILSREHTTTLRNSDALNDKLAAKLSELEARHRDIAVLNEELRHQVASRSRDIADALMHSVPSLSAPPPSAGALQAGAIVGDRYSVIRRIGAGAMGAVYEARRTTDGQRFALKILAREGNPENLARFAREAQIVAEIDHPNVVGIADVDVSSAGVMYLVMELVAGKSLEQVALEGCEIPRALALLAQIASGLAAVHARGVVHRDLKPANVLITDVDGTLAAKIADFGIASVERVTHSTPTPASGLRPAQSLTETGIIMGTPRYMAPELVLGAKQVEPPADVFSFGLMAYELLSHGTSAFLEPPVVAFFNGRMATRTRAFGVICPELSPAIGAILDRTLLLEPGGRPTAPELVVALGNELVDGALRHAAAPRSAG